MIGDHCCGGDCCCGKGLLLWWGTVVAFNRERLQLVYWLAGKGQ